MSKSGTGHQQEHTFDVGGTINKLLFVRSLGEASDVP
jgi:hypothetical protein